MEDLSRITAAQVRGTQGEHLHPMTIGDRLSKLESAMEDAVTSGTLSGDQAIQMKKELDDISKILSHNSHKQNGSNKQTGSSTQLPANDREKIRSHLQDLEKQLSSALNPKGATDVPAAAARRARAEIEDLFKAMDTNRDGKIGRDELTSYVNKTTDFYGRQGSMTISVSITPGQFSTLT
jgi:EF hand